MCRYRMLMSLRLRFHFSKIVPMYKGSRKKRHFRLIYLQHCTSSLTSDKSDLFLDAKIDPSPFIFQSDFFGSIYLRRITECYFKVPFQQDAWDPDLVCSELYVGATSTLAVPIRPYGAWCESELGRVVQRWISLVQQLNTSFSTGTIILRMVTILVL